MLKKIQILVLATLAGCGSSALDPSNAVTDHSKRYENERVSVLPPHGDDWYVYVDKGNVGTIQFRVWSVKSRDKVRNFTIMLHDYIGTFDGGDFEGILQLLTQKANKQNQYEKSRGSGLYEKVSVVERAGMRCIERRRDSPATSVGGKNRSVDYSCETPNQKEALPLIKISYFESTHPSVPFLGPDAVMKPIWDSMQFKHVDLENAPGYKKWRVDNVRVKEEQRILNEAIAAREAREAAEGRGIKTEKQ